MLHLTTLTLLTLLPAADQPVTADVVIRNATLYDGTGGPARKGDLAIRGDRIVALGSFTAAGTPQVIDGTGLAVAPGFIDLHTHSDTALTHEATRANLSYLTQGVTTVVTGNCGSGPVDVAAYFKTLEGGRVGSNVIHLVPHNSVRQAVMHNANRVPTADELTRMEGLIDRGMSDGAWGMSTGLIYNPGAYAKTEELIDLSRVVARHDGFYASHVRNEGVGVLDAVAEAIRIGREAGLPVHVSHLKASGRKAWGKGGEIIGLIEDARRKGQAVTADQYPYTASSTSLRAMVVPPRFREGTEAEYLARLDDPDSGPLIRKAIEQTLDGRDGGKSLRVASYQHHAAWNGKDLDTIAGEEKKSVTDIILEIEHHGGAQMISFGMNEEDVRLIMKQPWVATASDGSSHMKGNTMPHPRSYGCFPRKIGRYAIADGVLAPEQAVRSASGLPADILHLRERGYLREGYFADVVVFDPDTFRDTATYDNPHQFATGVRWLFVNGQPAIKDGRPTGALAGKVLRHQDPPAAGRPRPDK
jgi:N-acyl-D-aspartate/D-glutamate deacylase